MTDRELDEDARLSGGVPARARRTSGTPGIRARQSGGPRPLSLWSL